MTSSPPNVDRYDWLLPLFDGKEIEGLTFCRMVYEALERVRETRVGRDDLRVWSEHFPIKRLHEELLPLCRFVQHKYRSGRYIAVRWRSGNQQGDAELTQRGAFIDMGTQPALLHLEVTCAMHPNEHWTGKLLNRDGSCFATPGITPGRRGRPVTSEAVAFDQYGAVQALLPFVLQAIKKKAEKRYPADTSLMIQACTIGLCLPDEWQWLVKEVREAIPQDPGFREIVMVDDDGGLIADLWG